MAIVKATLTIKSSYAAATAPTGGGGLNLESWGTITLWDIRPWLPYTSRSLLGSGSWSDYLERSAVMDSTAAPGYSSGSQGPKSWASRTDSVVIYDTTGVTTPFVPCSAHGLTNYSSTYDSGSVSSPIAFDPSSLANFLDTLVVSAYAYNSQTPQSGFTVGTDELRIYRAYVDVELDTGVTNRYHANSAVAIPQGTGSAPGTPTEVVDAANAVDRDSSTYASIQETNGFFFGSFVAGISSLWHPAVLLLDGWTGFPPDDDGTVYINHSFYGVTGLGTGKNTSFAG